MADNSFGPFFELREAKDLLEKLRHDHGRIQENPIDSYAAFDFFVTANQLVDWYWPTATRQQRRDTRNENAVLRICHHLADGAKHFLLDGKHQGVKSTTLDEGAFDPALFFSGAYDTRNLVIELTDAEAKELGMPRISVRELSWMVLEYWVKRFPPQ